MVRDGCRLYADIYRPADVPSSDLLVVVWQEIFSSLHTAYLHMELLCAKRGTQWIGEARRY